MNDFDHYKNHYIHDLTEDRKYFSNLGKAEREQDCVHWFLQMIDVEHNCVDLEAPDQASIVDVKWKNANFQVKEIADPKVKRGEIKEILSAVENAESFGDLNRSLVGTGRDIPEVTSMCDLVYQRSVELSAHRRYTSAKTEVDLLFYITRTYSSLLKADDINRINYAKLGWRSISVLNSKQAAVISASNDAPDCLRDRVGRIYCPS
ncbi:MULTISPECIES: DUF1780 domain-containing protein [Thalassospira]|uniref:Uncharacterized protein n=2 Tax=Thalassospira TaxID=168934 RepID=A0A367W1F7_9PROT|nr:MULTISPECIES: DUF1780 domain-containing protein [Thalassospira]MDG4721543.1 DUF1780 domain-containing protein [Thalassospira sp. FZY0004]RCK31030.1 hypothetical protein TH19_22170 [Thalassospira profundimaris]